MSTTETSWGKVVSDFRRVCIARREQRAEEADRLLHDDLPRSIAEWSRESPIDGARKKSQLDQMFQFEQRRIDDAWLLHNLLTLRLTDEIVPTICARVSESVREVLAAGSTAAGRGMRPAAPAVAAPRVAFDDVAGVIDLLLAQERTARPAAVHASCL